MILEKDKEEFIKKLKKFLNEESNGTWEWSLFVCNALDDASSELHEEVMDDMSNDY